MTFYGKDYTMSDGRLRAYSELSGYPIFYRTQDGSVVCPACANAHANPPADADDDKWRIIAADINFDQPDMYCDHCEQRIERAYDDRHGE